MDKSTSIYQPPKTALTFIYYLNFFHTNSILLLKLHNIFFLALKTSHKNKNRKYIFTNFSHFSEDYFSYNNFFEINNTNNKIFFNNKNKKKLMLISKKTK